MKKIHFSEGEVWQYQIGKSFVAIRNPDNKKFVCTIHYLMDVVFGVLMPNDTKPDHYKKDEEIFDYPRPCDIKTYVERKLR